ncbi:MAG: DUF58 domain-containing protein [Rubricoccaceae bacterium]
MIPRELLRKIRRLEVRTRGRVESVFGGAYHSAFKGRGIEFAEVRPYLYGDDVRAIDWNVSARLGEPFVKLYHEEREQTLLLLVDVSASGHFGRAGQAKRDLAAEVCALLGFSALRNNDQVGLALFTDRVERFVPPGKGRRHVLRLVRDLYAHEAAARGTRLAAALEHALRVLRRRAIVVLVSDFLDAGYGHALRAVAARHDLVAVRVVDAREEALPPVGLLAVVDAETGRPALVDTGSAAARAAFAAHAARQRAATEALLAEARVDLVTVRTGEDAADPLAAFFRRRNRSPRR